MENFTIRNANPSDIDDIMEVEKAAFIPEIQEEKNVFLERIKAYPQLFLIFQHKNKIAGYLCGEYLNKIPETADEIKLGHIPAAADKNFLYISSFALLPEFRGSGNGKLLWNNALKYIGSEANYILLVNEEWKSAMHIYENSGFEIIKKFENFFKKSENSFSNALLMQKKYFS